MTIYNNINEFNSRDNTILTIGTFDGVHLGHQKVLERLTNTAIENNLESTVLTFFSTSKNDFKPKQTIKAYKFR
jgi:riboflavin kinase/FMN adenylyltransferase